MRNKIRLLNKKYKFSNLTEERIGPGPLLLPEEEEFGHDHILYGEDQWSTTILKDGKMTDTSKVRGTCNISKPNYTFTSRNMELF